MNKQATSVLAARGIGKTVKSGEADLVILREIDLAVMPGEVVAIVGASGSGKSTLLALLAGLDTPTTGTVELAGRADAEDKAREILARVGLAERLQHYPKHLSGGEQQRVALARAFVVRPQLLLADEPTGSLDVKSGEAVIELLFQLNREAGTTLVMVTHDEHLAQRCTRIVRLAAGRIAA